LLTNPGEAEDQRCQLLEPGRRVLTSPVASLSFVKKELSSLRSQLECGKALQQRCAIARESGVSDLISFAKMLIRHSYGIINHCRYAIHTSRPEGINNKIKVIKRKAFGFHDEEYFSLIIIKDAFATSD